MVYSWIRREIDVFILANEICSEWEFDKRSEIAESYSDSIQMTLMELESLSLEPPPRNVQESAVNVDNTNSNPKLRNPHVPFPEFDGKPEKYRGFIPYLTDVVSRWRRC